MCLGGLYIFLIFLVLFLILEEVTKIKFRV